MAVETSKPPESAAVPPTRNRPAGGFTLLEAFVTLVLVLVLIEFLLPMNTCYLGPRARQAQCLNNQKQIAIALMRYEQDFDSLPPVYTVNAEGERLHGWRTLILPYLDEATLYQSIDLTKPWNDPVNAQALAKAPSVYRCPDSSSHSPSNWTTYLAVVAPDGCFPADPARPRRLAEILDAPRSTLMVSETGPRYAVPWMAPVDADEALILRIAKDWAPPHEGRSACFVDGSARLLKADTSARTLRALTSSSGGEETPLLEGW